LKLSSKALPLLAPKLVLPLPQLNKHQNLVKQHRQSQKQPSPRPRLQQLVQSRLGKLLHLQLAIAISQCFILKHADLAAATLACFMSQAAKLVSLKAQTKNPRQERKQRINNQ
jgi:hypothetical protein